MKNTLSIWLLSMTAVVLAGCSQSAPQATAPTPSVDPLTAAHTEFVAQYEKCEINVKDCAAVGRDTVIEGTITKIHDGIDLVDISNDQGPTRTIPILSNIQDWRSTVLVNQSGNRISVEDISVWDNIRADVRAFDRIENGQLTEKLGQYGYIQITQQWNN